MKLPFKRKPFKQGDSYVVSIPIQYFNEGLLNQEEELSFTVETNEETP
jgi:antitoxin component of MazEF toxin-antitoxin module